MMRVIRSRGHEGRSKGCSSVLRARARIISQTMVSALLRRLLSGVSDMEQRFFSNDNTIILLSVIDMCLQIRSRKSLHLHFLIIVVVYTVIVIKLIIFCVSYLFFNFFYLEFFFLN